MREPSRDPARSSGSPRSTPSAADERRLLAALRAGDRSAAETLVEQTYRQIFGAQMKLCGDPDLAADLTQETYRRAWSSLGSFRGQARFGTWLYRIAYTTFLNHIRRPRPVEPLEQGADEADSRPPLDPADPHPGPEEQAVAGVAGEALRRAVLALPEDLRYTVSARFWGEQTVAEIARAAGITPVAIRKRLKKALHLLALALDEEGPDDSSDDPVNDHRGRTHGISEETAEETAEEDAR